MTSHDNVTDIVERLNNELGWGIGPAMLCQEAAQVITTLRKQLENAREALEKIAHLDVPRPVAVQYMPNRPSKHDKCAHDVWMYEECGNCISDFATEALKGQPVNKPSGIPVDSPTSIQHDKSGYTP